MKVSPHVVQVAGCDYRRRSPMQILGQKRKVPNVMSLEIEDVRRKLWLREFGKDYEQAKACSPADTVFLVMDPPLTGPGQANRLSHLTFRTIQKVSKFTFFLT